MAKSIRVSIQEPCHERWEEMTPTQQGAFCQSCQRQVIDFTNKTENEIYEMVSNSSGSGCGRFNTFQIEQPIRKTEINRSFFNWKAIAASLATFISAERALAGGEDGAKIPYSCASKQIIRDTVSSNPGLMKKQEDTTGALLKGTIIDAQTLEPIEGAYISVYGLEKVAKTDSKGAFAIYLPENVLKSKEAALRVYEFHHYEKVCAVVPYKSQEESANCAEAQAA